MPAYVVVPAVALAGELQATFFPYIIPGDGCFGCITLYGSSSYIIVCLECFRVGGGGTVAQHRFGIDQVYIGEPKEVTDTMVTGVTDTDEPHAIAVIRRKYEKKSVYFRIAFDPDMQLIGMEIKKK